MLGDQAKELVSSIKNKTEERKEKEKKKIIFQLCEKHVALNMEVKIKRTDKYNEEKVRELTNQIWAYI